MTGLSHKAPRPNRPRSGKANESYNTGAQSQDTEDPLDLFDSSLGTIFDIAPIGFAPSSGEWIYEPPPASISSQSASGRPLSAIRLKIPQPAAAVHTRLQANYVWLAGIYLADMIATGRLPVEGKRVCELGAGAGLPGVMACVRGAEVVSSDWGDESIMAALKQNFASAVAAIPDRAQPSWKVVPHRWGSDVVSLTTALSTAGQSSKFDILLLADTLWITEAHSDLLDSIFSLLERDAVAHIAAGLHTGRGPVERFVSAARSRGAVVQLEYNARWKSSGGWETFADQTRASELEEERGVVVYYTLRLPART